MYRVTHQSVTRNEDGERVVYEKGDTFDATDAEISAFGDRLEKVEDEPETEVLTVDEVLADAGIDPDDYDGLVSEASEHDDIDGRQDKETLQKALAEKLR